MKLQIIRVDFLGCFKLQILFIISPFIVLYTLQILHTARQFLLLRKICRLPELIVEFIASNRRAYKGLATTSLTKFGLGQLVLIHEVHLQVDKHHLQTAKNKKEKQSVHEPVKNLKMSLNCTQKEYYICSAVEVRQWKQRKSLTFTIV